MYLFCDNSAVRRGLLKQSKGSAVFPLVSLAVIRRKVRIWALMCRDRL